MPTEDLQNDGTITVTGQAQPAPVATDGPPASWDEIFKHPRIKEALKEAKEAKAALAAQQQAQTEAEQAKLKDEAKWQQLYETAEVAAKKLKDELDAANYDQAKDWQTRPESDAVEPRQIDTASQVKVTVNADGLYRVTYNDLSNAGVTAGTLNTLNPRTFRLLDAGVEQHIYVVGENDGVFNPSDTIPVSYTHLTLPTSDLV